MARDPENTLILELKSGPVAIALRPDLAPDHVARIKELTRKGFYDGVVFHRVIPGFMAQTGDPTGTGAGGSDLPDLKAEFSGEKHKRGTVSAARAQDENSANSQFFIMFMPHLGFDHKYTIFGNVIDGMQYVDGIERGEPPANPTRIVHAWIAADSPPAYQAPAPAPRPNLGVVTLTDDPAPAKPAAAPAQKPAPAAKKPAPKK